MTCTLCSTTAHQPFYSKDSHIFFKCTNCDALFRSSQSYLAPDQEHERYQNHNNDVTDPGYQQFVLPLVEQVVKCFDPDAHKGLDYGAGPGPVITALLKEKGFRLNLYDPYFWPDKTVLEQPYDFIVCCEVMEHFNNPKSEFKKLKTLLHPGGQLICKTALYDTEIDFDAWYYKNDPTHVFLYTINTLDWIKTHYGFKQLERHNGIIVWHA